MNQFLQILRRFLLAVSWIIMIVIASVLFIGSFGNLGVGGLIGTVVSVGLAFALHKLINWILTGSAFKTSIQNKRFAKAIYRQNKRLSTDEIVKLSKFGLSSPISENPIQPFILPKGERFSISSTDWYLVNSSNYWSQKVILDALLKDGIEKWPIVDQENPIYNYLFHPSTLENSKGDHINITVTAAAEVTTEENLDRAYKASLSAFKRINPTIIDFKLDLIDRPKLAELPKSTLATLTLPKQVTDILSIQAENTHYIISSSSGKKNRDFYRHTMFEIVDSLKFSNT